MAKILIIGAGLTGISTAYHLEKNDFYDYQIIEKENEIGGLCGSVQQDGFTFDYTGHLLHTSDDYFYKLIDQVCDFKTFNRITRKSFIYSHGTFTRYPFQTNLYGLPQKVINECINGYKIRPDITNPHMFIDWVQTQFGSGFAKHFFLPYQEKIFAYDAHKLTADWTSRFVPQTSLERIEKGAYQDIDDEQGYNAHFYYPKSGGIFSWVKKLANQLKNPIRLNCGVQKIDMKEKIIACTDSTSYTYQTIINTIPLDRLLGIIDEPASSSMHQARKHLKCNTVINFNLGIARTNLTDKHWIYFPEKEFPFYRLGFPHNFSANNAPPNCSSIYGEVAFYNQKKDHIQDLVDKALQETKDLFNISNDEIVTEVKIPISHAYVIFDAWRQNNLPALLKRLTTYNIHSIGRYGAWKYASMQEAVLDGKEMAETIIKEHI